MKELTIISGKGGTGKTSIVAAFADLAPDRVLVDADVDAADLHLVVAHRNQHTHEFRGGHVASIIPEKCTQCGECVARCHFGAIDEDYVVDPVACEGCGVCHYFCPENAVNLEQRMCGEWYVSQTGRGPMVHARLGIAEENSGLLVTVLRKEAKRLAEKQEHGLILTDGPPGIGCPVIAAVTGADAVLLITEPTQSGMHDMQRVIELCAFLKIPAMLCINKYDINPEMTERIAQAGARHNAGLAGKIPYDRSVTDAMVHCRSLVAHSTGPGAQAIKALWHNVASRLNGRPAP